jgi:DNA repair protein RadD
MKLRPYQEQALNEIRAHYANGRKKVLLKLPTGSGKTLIFCTVLKSVHAKGHKAIMVVRGKALVDQASQRLEREGVPHGVQQAGHWRAMPDEPIQICSIDTLYRRKIAPDAHLIVIDECHMASSPSFRWLLDNYDENFILGVTATPYSKGGLRHIADEMVAPISMTELIAQGYLVPAKYYIPSKIDLSGLAIDKKTGDYALGPLESRMDSAILFGDIIASYRRLGEDRPTLCFAVSVAHSIHLMENFNAAGIPSAHIEADTSLEARQKIIGELEANRIKIICSVGTMTTGVDIPCVSCIIMARPTKSYTLYVQAMGRATRTFPGKENFIVLDHAANIEEHGLIENEREIDLDGKESKERKIQIVMCKQCFRAFVGTVCPSCSTNKKGSSNEERNTSTDERVELVEVKSTVDLEKARINSFVEKTIEKARRRNYKAGWVYHQLKERFGDKHAKSQWTKIKELLPDRPRQASYSDHPFDE